MTKIKRSNIDSKTFTGTNTFPMDKRRAYFNITMTSGSGVLEVGGGGGGIPLAAGVHYEPRICPTSELTITTVGTYIVSGIMHILETEPEAFTPLELFQSGEQGVWYEPSDLSTLFQDAAGTTPVTSDGDPVGLMQDKSGNGNHATQSVSASRPTNEGISFDGVDDAMLSSVKINPPCTIACAVNVPSEAGNRYIFGGGYYAADVQGYGFVAKTNGKYAIQARIGNDPISEIDGDSRGAANIMLARIASDGSIRFSDLSGDYSSSAIGTITATTSIAIGTPDDFSASVGTMNGDFFCGLVIDRELSDDELSDLKAHMADKAGVTL
jgi:hypothetical protein